MIITAKYGSHHFNGYEENAILPFSDGRFLLPWQPNQETDWQIISYLQLPLPI